MAWINRYVVKATAAQWIFYSENLPVLEETYVILDEQFKEVLNTMIDLKTIVDILPIAIFVVDRDRRILLSNRAAQKIHCIDRRKSNIKRFGDIIGCLNADENAAGCGYSTFCQLCQAKAMIDQAFAAKKNIAHFEATISTRSGETRCLKMTATYIRENELLKPEQEMCLVSVEDVTELKKKNRLAAASETIGAICHEINQPLQAIMGNVELLLEFQLGDGAISRLEKIISEMERIKNITNKLLNLTNYHTKPYLSTNILDVERSAG